MSVRTAAGQVVENIGTAFGGDEGTWSELIAGQKTPLTGVTPESQKVFSNKSMIPRDRGGIMVDRYGNQIGSTDTGVMWAGGGTPQPSGASPTSTSTPVPTNNGGNGGGGGGGGGNDSGGYTPGQGKYAGWDPDAEREDRKAKGDFSNDGGGGGQSIEDLINATYGAGMGRLDEYEKTLGKTKMDRLAGVDVGYGRKEELIGREEGDLDKILEQQGIELTAGERSALTEAQRDYNALTRQSMGYGQGSSVGGALSEILRKAYLQTGAKTRDLTRQGRAKLQEEQRKAETYIFEKKNAILEWKENSIASIKDQFDAGIQQIMAQKGLIEGQKNQMKMDLLQQAITLTQTVNAQDQAVKQQLAQYAIESMQEAENRTLTPEEISTVYNNMMSQNITSSQAPASQTAYQNKNIFGKGTDEYENLLSMNTAAK